ncbi:MAG: taurine dioxygenase [Rhodospirillaceae bacterium]|nr:taurine dioxygenase [Rhodospirillaceae bacterium]
MTYQTIDVTPISGAMGAEVAGVDLSGDLSNAVFDDIHQAFLDHQLLMFRDQAITPQQQVGFARRFGGVDIYPFMKGLAETPEVVEILKTETDETNFGAGWHLDTAYLQEPAGGAVLHGLEIPTFGGDTLFANTYLAYDALSDGLKATLDGLTGINNSALRASGGRDERMNDLDGMKDQYNDAGLLVAEHPVVRTHPETGRKALYVNRNHTVRFKDMTDEESAPLLGYLFEHLIRPEFTCRLRWTPDAVAVWDNRCTQHNAVNDYHGHRRRMHRVTISGDPPR